MANVKFTVYLSEEGQKEALRQGYPAESRQHLVVKTSELSPSLLEKVLLYGEVTEDGDVDFPGVMIYEEGIDYKWADGQRFEVPKVFTELPDRHDAVFPDPASTLAHLVRRYEISRQQEKRLEKKIEARYKEVMAQFESAQAKEQNDRINEQIRQAEVDEEGRRIMAEDAAAEEAERRAWIEAHGSERLKKIFKYDMLEDSLGTYRAERVAFERPGWAKVEDFVSAHGGHAINFSARRNPTLQELNKWEQAMETLCPGTQLRYVHVTDYHHKVLYEGPVLLERDFHGWDLVLPLGLEGEDVR